MEEKERPAPMEVEPLFNGFVVEYGGELVSNLIPRNNVSLNADYVFEKQNVIAELKCFQKDLFNEKEEEARMQSLVEKWTKDGMLNDESVMQIVLTGQLPSECKAEMIQAARKTIDRVIYHANKQIIATKTLLGMPDAKGLLLLCNDGNYFLTTLQFIGLICNVMENKYMDSEIDGFVYFTINQVSRSNEDEIDHRIWYPVYRNEEDTLANFVNDLGLVFNDEYYPKVTGIADVHKFVSDNIEEGNKQIGKLFYLPKDIAYKGKRGK